MRAHMSVKVISRKINARKVTVKMVDGSLVHGKVNIYHDEEVVQRVSDIFTKVTDPFIVVFDVTADGRSGRVLIINKRNIAWVSPEEEDPVRQEAEKDEEPAESRVSWMERMRSP
jgi:small nuclear ribonucleoprotein (snRNP)-like protein